MRSTFFHGSLVKWGRVTVTVVAGLVGSRVMYAQATPTADPMPAAPFTVADIVGIWGLKGKSHADYVFRADYKWAVGKIRPDDGGEWRLQGDTLMLGTIRIGRKEVGFEPMHITRDSGQIFLQQGNDFRVRVYQRVDTLPSSTP